MRKLNLKNEVQRENPRNCAHRQKAHDLTKQLCHVTDLLRASAYPPSPQPPQVRHGEKTTGPMASEFSYNPSPFLWDGADGSHS